MSDEIFTGFADEATPEMKAMAKAAVKNPEAYAKLAKALTLPLQEAVMKGGIYDIFDPMKFEWGVATEYPIHFMNAGDEKDFVAFTIPAAGAIPHKEVQGDYVMVPTFDDGNAIDCNKRYVLESRWDVLADMVKWLVNGHIVKMNRDAWRVILAAAVARGIAVYDSEATAGYFTKRLVSLLRIAFGRYGGGNSTSVNRFKMTDLYMSPESMEDIRNWDLTQIDDASRKDIFLGNGEYALSRIYGTNLHDLFELGVGQEFQSYYTGTLGASMSGSKTEIVVGLDLTPGKRAFVNPVRMPVTVTEDRYQERNRRFSLWSESNQGWSALESRCVMIGQV